MALPPALAGFAGFDQFILWKAVPKPNGKTDKVPTDPATGLPCNSQDPAQWMSYDAAKSAAKRLGLGIAFVFTYADPFWFVDVDDALQPDGTWSPIATWVYQLFPGASYELSQSGKGFHLFGRYSGTLPPHSNKRADWDVEFYSGGRFVALTENETRGAVLDLDAEVRQYIGHYPPKAAADDAAWTDGPEEGASAASLDDAELIRRMLRPRAPGAAAAFQGKATVRELWEADADALGRNFPDGGGRPYDASAADAALLSHLAFWTGKHCERMDRLYRESGLMRDKWESRPDYRQRSILYAVGACSAVYVDPRAAEPGDGPPAIPIVEGFQYLTPAQQIEYFAGCVYVGDQHRIFTPSGVFLSPQQFRAEYAGYVFAMDMDGSDTSKNPFEAFVESRALRHPKVRSAAFRPEMPAGLVFEEEGVKRVNSYTPSAVRSIPGDVSRFLDLTRMQVTNERDHEMMLSYMAFIVQNPGVKAQWCLVLQGCEGNGKTFLMQAVAAAVGERFSHFPNAQDLANKFNGWLPGRLFIGIEEVYQPGHPEIIEALKPMITNLRIEIQAKGMDQFTGDNRANFMLGTNHRDAIRKTANDRRYCVIYMAHQCVEDLRRDGLLGPTFFPELYAWFRADGAAHITHYLQNYAIADEFNPAKGCHRAPDSSSLQEVIIAGRNQVEQILADAIEEGRYGCAKGWVSTTGTNSIYRGIRGVTFKQRTEALASLGYIPHPNLPNGRVSAPIATEGGRKPRLYVREGSLHCNLEGPAIVAAYLEAQGGLVAPTTEEVLHYG